MQLYKAADQVNGLSPKGMQIQGKLPSNVLSAKSQRKSAVTDFQLHQRQVFLFMLVTIMSSL